MKPMNLFLGIRIAFAGGRESVARIVLMTAGVAVGVLLLMFGLSAMPAMEGRIDRLAWHRTDAASPATAPDRALWLPVTDWYAGRMVTRIQVAGLGPQPPVPPGLDRLPGPGEVVVSPELARLMRTVPDDQLRNRFPGEVTGTIGPDGLISPRELVAVIGRTPAELRGTAGAFEIRGIEQPGEGLDLAEFFQVGIGFMMLLLVGPVVVFVSLVARVGAARREERFAAIRLAGATQWQTGVLAATETAVAATTGAAVGWFGYLAAQPVAARHVTFDGTPFFPEDFLVPTGDRALVLVGVPLLTIAITLVSLRRVQFTPLGVRRYERRQPPGVRRLIPLALGIACLAVTNGRGATDGVTSWLFSVLALFALVLPLIGAVLAGPLVCMWISHGLAGVSRHAPTLIAARRIAADPYTAARAVVGVAVAAMGATGLVALAAGVDGLDDDRSVLDPGVVAIQVSGAPEAALAPLVSDGAVVARSGPGGHLVVRCADLARVSRLTCPPSDSRDFGPAEAGLVEVRQYGDRQPAVDRAPDEFAEPGPGDEKLPVHSLFVPTDGSTAAKERIRTLAAVTVPHALSRTGRDLAYDYDEAGFDRASTGSWFALGFVLLVAACSLAVSAVTGLIERRRPFALLRASGVRLGELRQIALLETALPMAVAVVGGAGIAMLVTVATTPVGKWTLPAAEFFVGLGVAVLVAVAVCALTLPLINRTTRPDTVRFE